uniref:DUF1764 domain-containing protein n=1 Tax=Aplanochytrium stocchinoi TaxID=215587 RepID=A0A6S8BGP4_9STRA|mmetsp:Transcript_7296/g.9245  ORF Transcript_7296/g.9245 Transcript_7296/m.9245 type:complete len:143 (+) Transcript_7296:131-559(+)|eukprot:CAMPEP_0204829448 /NCGR_PEP_ID=MMETSP1346-20131115/7622_1 /ASSEMBLY_ACC=CAM_ASM_000771 /TAXON_ID=215587 /ORGANISM="Aplanochytrium stocchinoi, Strain GSBS06" /LENGTH=142 /DNA_ID=CAMNT_0051959237 /DNA_START=28 /DNA_END=456 /DNA_ORIENTATION=-
MKDQKKRKRSKIESQKVMIAEDDKGQKSTTNDKGKKMKISPEKSTKKSNMSDMDEIFSTGVKEAAKKKEKLQLEKEKQELLAKQRRQSFKAERKKANVFRNQDPKPVKYDAKEGLNIYTMESLGIGKGGYTKDCPFDCNCCF